MNQLTNEEIARVLAMYWNCKMSTIDGHGTSVSLYPKCIEVKLENISIGQELHGLISKHGGMHQSYPIYGGGCKPILKALNKITDEHKKIVAQMAYHLLNESDDDLSYIGYGYISSSVNISSNVNQQLILWGYAVKLYFGHNHWANGKTAIELGIAIEK